MNRVIFWNAPITISGIECFMSSLSYRGVLRAHGDDQGGETHRLPSCWLLREISETNTCVHVAFLSWSWINRVKKIDPPVPSWNGWAQSIWDYKEPRPGEPSEQTDRQEGLKTHTFHHHQGSALILLALVANAASLLKYRSFWNPLSRWS